MSQAIDDLKHEHDVILMSLGILDAMCRRIELDQMTDKTDLSHFIDFLKEFADQCHHGKEENFLFPMLVSAGIPNEDGPIGVMLSEHDAGRNWIRLMEASMQSESLSAEFIQAARAYGDLLRSHIDKENTILFPTAEKVLSLNQLSDLFQQFEEYEERVIGLGRHEQLHDHLRAMRTKYLV